jgi:hypothetical protein
VTKTPILSKEIGFQFGAEGYHLKKTVSSIINFLINSLYTPDPYSWVLTKFNTINNRRKNGYYS